MTECRVLATNLSAASFVASLYFFSLHFRTPSMHSTAGH